MSVRNLVRGCQSLERRFLMAGDVTVQLSSEDSRDLEIRGDNFGNSILIEEVAADLVRVTGRDGTLINGQRRSVEFRVTDDISIDMRRGDDHVDIRDLKLDNQSHSDLMIELGQDQDEIEILATDVARVLQIDGGDGGDQIDVDEVQVLDLRVYGEDGSDDIHIQDSLIDRDIIVHGGDRNDDIRIENVEVLDDIWAYGDAGNDSIELYDLMVNDQVRLEGGTGDDTLFTSQIIAEDLTFLGESGDDSVYIIGTDIHDRVYVSLGSGSDYLHLNGNEVGRHYVNGGSGVDRWYAMFLVGNWYWGLSNFHNME